MHFLMQFSICLLLSGAIGNLIDRVALGYVRDMIYVAAINFPVFNVADMAVCVGCGLLMLDILFFKGKNYLAVHRIAVSGDKLRRGVASQAMGFVEQMAKEAGRDSVRIDTHRGNAPMRAMLERNGYVMCGSVYLENGEHRVAYEKIVK